MDKLNGDFNRGYTTALVNVLRENGTIENVIVSRDKNAIVIRKGA